MQKSTEKPASPSRASRFQAWLLPDGDSPQRLGRRALLVLLAAASLLYGIGLGTTDLWAPDEPRYGAIAEEMRSFRHGAGGLALLHLNDIPYTQKPPLYFWLAAAFGVPEGHVHEISARLPSAIAGVVCVGLTAWIGLILFGQAPSAILAAGILATSFRFAFTARRAQLDVLLTAFELAAIAIFLLLEFRRGGVENARRFPLALAGLHACLGAAALTKGPVGWLPLLIFAAYLAWCGRIRAWRELAPLWAWLLSLGPILVWIGVAVALAPSGFSEIAVGENLIGRFFLGTSHARPFYYYAIQLPLDFMPWSLLLPFAIPPLWHCAKTIGVESADAGKRSLESESGPTRSASARFLCVWLIIPLVFFTLSAGKRGLYLLPIFPALALVSIFAGGHALNLGPLAASAIRRLRLAIAGVATIEIALFALAMPLLNEEKSPRPIAEAATLHSQEGEEIGVLGMSPLEGGIAYYTDRPVVSLRNESDLPGFFANGGRLVILRGRDLERLEARGALQSIQSFRRGRRNLALAARIDTRANQENP